MEFLLSYLCMILCHENQSLNRRLAILLRLTPKDLVNWYIVPKKKRKCNVLLSIFYLSDKKRSVSTAIYSTAPETDSYTAVGLCLCLYPAFTLPHSLPHCSAYRPQNAPSAWPGNRRTARWRKVRHCGL